MSQWISVALVIAVVLAFLMMRERWRISALEKWARTRGFKVITPFTPPEDSPAARLARRFTARGARRWGAGLEGSVDDVPVTIAEFETTWAGAREQRKWQTIAFWGATGPSGPVVVWNAPGFRLLKSTARVDERLGLEGVDPETLGMERSGLFIEGEPAVRERWLDEGRLRDLLSWPHPMELTADSTHAGWRIEGVMTAARLETILRDIPRARRLLA